MVKPTKVEIRKAQRKAARVKKKEVHLRSNRSTKTYRKKKTEELEAISKKDLSKKDQTVITKGPHEKKESRGPKPTLVNFLSMWNPDDDHLIVNRQDDSEITSDSEKLGCDYFNIRPDDEDGKTLAGNGGKWEIELNGDRVDGGSSESESNNSSSLLL